MYFYKLLPIKERNTKHMLRHEIWDKLEELHTDYWSYSCQDVICLDGDYTIEQLKLFIQLIESQQTEE
jgi:hypothetical protein